MRSTLKTLANLAATLVVLPSFALYTMARLLIGAERAFPGWAQAYGLVPGLVGIYVRRAFYRLVFPRCADDVTLCFGCIFSHPTAELGHNVYVGPYSCLGDVTLEDDVLIGSQVSIINGGGQHGIGRLDLPIREQPGVFPRVKIGRDSWIGERSVILANVGRQCVVAAGSVVTRPLPDFAIVAPIPAKIVRFRQEESIAPHSTPPAEAG
jgi:acetyltransferase-like isoleucine patch superfamily enzyme